jgi:hypothetical protein
LVTGGRDYSNHPVIECQPEVLDRKMMDDKLIKDGLLHLMSIPEDKAQSAGVLFILDSRNSSDESVSRLLHIIVQICRGGKVFKAVVISSETRVL